MSLDKYSIIYTFLFIGQTVNVLNFSSKELTFDDSDDDSSGKFQFCIRNEPFPI